MMPAMSTIPLPGFFGKLPVRGDFLSRRVPATVRSQWEQWLADLTVAVKNTTGESLTHLWFAAPIWRFWLGQAIAPPPEPMACTCSVGTLIG